MRQVGIVRQWILPVGNAPAIGDQGRHLGDETDRLAHVGRVRVIVQIRIKAAQHRNAGAQRIHRVHFLWQEPEHLEDGLRQLAFRDDRAAEGGQLPRVRQLVMKQQIRDLFEVRLLGHLVNVVAAIHQPGIGIDPADGGFPGDHAGKSWAVSWFCFGSHKSRFT